MTATTRLIILGPVRSGTTAVASALREHPEIRMASREARVWPTLSLGLDVFLAGNGRFETRHERIDGAFDALTDPHPAPGVKVRGLKIAIEDEVDLLDAVVGVTDHYDRTRGDRKIVLVRRNDTLARYCSLELAHASHVWNTPVEVEKQRAEPRTLSPERFQQFLRTDRRMRAGFELIKEHCDVLELGYEQDIAAWDGLPRLLDWLGVRAESIQPGVRKVSPSPDAWVRNHAELAELMTSANDEDELEEVRLAVEQRRTEHHSGESTDYHLSHANWLLRTGRADEAHRAAVRALRRPQTIKRPMQIRAVRILRRTWRKLGRPARVRRAVEELRRLHGDAPCLLVLDAIHAGGRGDDEDARRLLDEAERAGPMPALLDEITDIRRSLDLGRCRWPS